MTFQDLGIDISKIGKTGKTTCPKCSHQRKNKHDKCLSVDTEKGVFKCHNCEYKGSIFEKRIKPQIKKIYIRPEPKFTDLTLFFSIQIRSLSLSLPASCCGINGYLDDLT